ncbi:MAG: hypothetical protein IJ881_08500 [Neisseriaceae bacterium]|nr:hypothetical protein [Neisseriaceae bacterium]MBR3425832.1 hypothetical protein [Neisseriaceae bacterium]
MINILLGLLIIVAVLLSLWAIQIKRKHGGGCGGCGTGCGNTCGGCGSSCLTEKKDEKEQ